MTRSLRSASSATTLALAAVVVFGTAHAVNTWMLDRKMGVLDAGSGDSIFERIGAVALVISAFAVAILALRSRSLSLGALGVLLAFLLVDDVFGIHEHVHGWRVVYLPLLAAVLFLLWRFGGLVRAGLILLVVSLVGGVAAERAVSRQGWRPGDIGYEAKILVKDGSEVAGWILVATGVVARALPPARP